MKRNFNEVMRRLRSYCEGVHPDTGNRLESNNKTNKLITSDNLDLEKNNKTHTTYNRDYRGLYLLIHTDKTLLLAQSWEMEPGLLYKLCKEYGVPHVKQSIQKVAGIGNRYFRNNEPIEPQRGRYCRKIIIEGWRDR